MLGPILLPVTLIFVILIDMQGTKLEEINDQATWDGFMASHSYAQFTQSWAWGEFQRGRGLEVKRLALVDKESQVTSDKLQAACQFIRQPGRFGMGYWFAPRGPVPGTDESKEQRDGLSEFVTLLQSGFRTKDRLIGVMARTLFVRFEPIFRRREDLSSFGLVRAHAMNPATTSLIDLAKSEDELLAAMHQKTRYNIKVAQKHGVTVREGRGEEDVLAFLRLSEETAQRDGFRSHAGAYLRATLEKSGLARLRIAELDGKALAANLEIAFGGTVTYLHGASSSENRNAMAPYLLHWEAMQTAKREGKRFYDLWGCNPADETDPYFKKSWEGISRFKYGWGGEIVNLAGTWDLPRWRWLYRLVIR